MLDKNISGLPVLDEGGKVVGIVTEGDLLRRSETGTERHRPRWLEILMGPGRLAGEYVRTHGRKVEEIMTADLISVAGDAPLDEVVGLMERRRIKRVPVIEGDVLVGVVSRADLLRSLLNAIEAHPNGEIYVGGSFNRAGGMVANGIAKWSNNSWTTLGSGVTGSSFGLSQVIAITVSSDGAVYAGGQFYSAGGIRATNIARWNTNNTWSALGSGLGLTYDSVSALATSGTNLYAGGRFSAAGKLPLANIARWDGASWQTMGSGITGGEARRIGTHHEQGAHTGAPLHQTRNL